MLPRAIACDWPLCCDWLKPVHEGSVDFSTRKNARAKTNTTLCHASIPECQKQSFWHRPYHPQRDSLCCHHPRCNVTQPTKRQEVLFERDQAFRAARRQKDYHDESDSENTLTTPLMNCLLTSTPKIPTVSSDPIGDASVQNLGGCCGCISPVPAGALRQLQSLNRE